MTPLLRDMIALHDGNVDEPRRELAAAGEMPDDEGSFMAVVRATIMDMRSLFNGSTKAYCPDRSTVKTQSLEGRRGASGDRGAE
jgi:hypothetical protein